jgi:hypothetical protein
MILELSSFSKGLSIDWFCEVLMYTGDTNTYFLVNW